MRKELTMIVPMLKGRLHIAYPMIAFMQHPDADDFLYNSFVNIECMKTGRDLNLCFTTPVEKERLYGLHHLNKHKNYNDFIAEKGTDLISAIIDEINQENYLYIFFDEYYLPNKNKFHKEHINMIYGYDSEQSIFMTVGYDEQQRYRQLIIPFDIVDQAFCCNTVEVFKTNYEKHFIFNESFFITQMKDFLLCENSFLEENEILIYNSAKNDFFYGINVYQRIFEHLLNYIDGEEFDFRNIHQLFELTMLNDKRLMYLKNNKNYKISNDLISSSHDIYSLTKIIRNMAIKVMVNDNRKEVNNIIEKLKIQKENMTIMYEYLLKFFV